MDKETIKIEVDNKEVNKILQFISEKVKDPKPILREFGKQIKEDIEWSFEQTIY